MIVDAIIIATNPFEVFITPGFFEFDVLVFGHVSLMLTIPLKLNQSNFTSFLNKFKRLGAIVRLYNCLLHRMYANDAGMTKIYILYENADWLPPLERELKAANLPYELWHIHNTVFDLTVAPPEGVFLNRMSPSSHTRGHIGSVDATREMIYWLESYGRRVVNGSAAFAFEVSKIKQYTALQQAGIATPKTIAAIGSAETLVQAAQTMAAPFITKHNRGGKGMGVQLFQSHAAYAAYVHSPDFQVPMDHVTLIQEYITPRVPQITRVEIVNGEFLYAIDVSTARGFELCPAEKCEIGDSFCPTTDDGKDNSPIERQSLFSLRKDFKDPIIEQYITFMTTHGIDVAGIEFIEDAKGQKFTYDINCTTNYSPGVEDEHGLNGMAKIVAYLKSLCS